MRKCILLCLPLFLLLSCSPKIHVRQATVEDVAVVAPSGDITALKRACYEPDAYVEHPELMRMKYIRVNFHFMNSIDGTYNMPESDVQTYVRDWLYATNENLGKNMKMFLPHGNSTPVLPIPYRYVLTPDPDKPGDQGIYYHIDDELCYAVKTGR